MRSVRRVQGVLAVVAAAALAVGTAGCVDSDKEAAKTPEGASTVTNQAPQTDSTGKTVPAPGAETTAEGGETTGGGGEAAGDVAAGQEFFANTCQGCHSNLGQDAGVGPKLAGGGRTADLIRATVEQGKGVMPPGLASGADLDNVVAFVLSIQ
ncbi:MAG: cytochrome c [Actinomycetota bacterium]